MQRFLEQCVLGAEVSENRYFVDTRSICDPASGRAAEAQL
jgi:hypothetical protein